MKYVRIILWTTVISIVAFSTLSLVFLWWCTAVSIGEPIPAVSNETVRKRIEADVRFLAQPRSDEYASHYDASEAYLRESLERMGWDVQSENVPGLNRSFANLWVELPGKSSKVVLVGAHYDSAYDTPGADDNASGVAIAMEMARRFYGKTPKHKLIIAFFANEEPPHFRTDRMGSHVMAQRLKTSSTKICTMISLEMLGYFTDEPNSQKYPPVLSWFYPTTGNFVGFVSDIGGRGLIKSSTEAFHSTSSLSAMGFAGPKSIQGIDYSDHMPFWNADFPAMMITDTSFFRNANYHKRTDTADTLNFESMVQVAGGVESVLLDFSFLSGCDRS